MTDTPSSEPPFSEEGTIEFRVRYQETDQMGVVYHANYFAWFEMGRTELLRSATGVSYRDLEASNSLLAIVKVECSYQKPAHYDDVLTLKTKVVRVTRVTIAHEYHLYRETELLAVGRTVLASVSREGHPKALPDFLRRKNSSLLSENIG